MEEEDEEEEEEEEENNSFETAVSHQNSDQNPPPDPLTPSAVSSQFLQPFDRGLIKRQSKGKYQVVRFGVLMKPFSVFRV